MQSTSVSPLNSRRLVIHALALCITLTASTAVPSHPHAWIDLRSTLLMTPENRITAIELEWLFDPLYTTLLLEDIGSTAESLREQASGMLRRLDEHSYFTEIRVNDETVATQSVHDFESGMRAGRYWVRFSLPLATSVDPSSVRLEYAVFDPTYYIEMLHLEKDVIEFHGDSAGQCIARITAPSPSTQAIIRARSPDVDKQPDQSLGALFAERVEVQCP